ncbi:alpha-1,2-fucosyltransferase [Pedobacter sp. MW01-1-1]|uniref:alpha-1,2-fucosyltransferase n=1 Tax=Pedobacter sp. MW01-1-1 TaxID=3383027 RepID=UPI003FF15213
MIICKLMGGLGNQMFQYATARYLAFPQKVHLDLSFLEKNTESTDVFTARAHELKIFENLYSSFVNPYYKKFIFSESPLLCVIKPKYQEINDNNISKFIHQGLKNIYLDGYFQNPSYFEEIKQELIQDFKFPQLHEAQENLANLIKTASNSVSLHIRRGDYLKPNLTDIHGVLNITYYKNAINYINQKIENPIFYIFSDDIEWCKQNFNFLQFEQHFISHTCAAWLDMYLMSICKHNIIANSSFSWWGALLNTYPDKIVIAPKNWFEDKALNEKAVHISPKNWIRL